MPLKNHKLIASPNVHVPHNWIYANQSARESATGFVASDEGKFARQTDNNSVWMLTGAGPPASWIEVTGSGGGSGLPSTLVFWARKASAGTILKGQPVYISSYDDVGGYAEVELADADVASKMPAIGLAYEDIDNTATKRVAAFGTISGIDTSSWGETDPLYISTTEGALTNTKPTGATSKIQKVGVVLHSDVGDGSIQVVGAGRTNDVPNIADGYVWKGDTNGQPQEVSLDTEITNSTHAGRTDNPHSVTKTQVSLGNVTNDAQLKRAAGDFATFTEKTAPVDADLVLIEDSEAANAKKKVQRVNFLPVFGTQFQQASSDTESSTSGVNWVEKVTIDATSIPAGTYRVGWSCETAVDGDDKTNLEVRVQVDDSTTLAFFRNKEKGTYGSGVWHPKAGIGYVTLTAASHTIDLDFKSNGGDTLYVRRARLEFWRVS